MSRSYREIKKYCDDHHVTLVTISKKKSIAEIIEVYGEGQRIFGENRVQELLSKQPLLPEEIEWHLVGHLQTNKVKSVIPGITLIHSVDSFKLLLEIDKQSQIFNQRVRVLLQMHIAKEDTKFGLSYEEARLILDDSRIKQLTHINIEGLMGMATLTEDQQQIRKEFRLLKEFFDEMKHSKPHLPLQKLSMGMSNDYRIAIEEGSTMVRIGSAIFTKP
jgi:pyridoxal phosphate enzyme (YggS family)